MFKYLDNMDCLALLSSILLAVFMLRLHYYKAAKYVRNVLVSQYVILGICSVLFLLCDDVVDFKFVKFFMLETICLALFYILRYILHFLFIWIDDFTDKIIEILGLADNSFNTDLLNTDIDLKKLSNRLVSLKKMDFSLCLYGAPGTGKSAYARYIAKKLKLKVVEKKASDLMDKYIGNTEKNISKAFKEAEKEKAMLILDEADSFLRDRTKAQRSWEVTRVNELLTQMEHYKFPFVCTTNLMKDLDKASLRRFIFKVKYDYMTLEQVVEAFSYFFHHKVDIEDIKELKALAPGDFISVRNKASILGCLKDKSELISMLKAEISLKNLR